MVGKNPHRPEGKARADNEHMGPAAYEGGMPYQSSPQKALHERDLETMERTGAPTRGPGVESIGGQRPGVPSRMEEAQARRLEREGEDEE